MHKAQEITKLDETVVNRIAAGEVVQRPASALKELIENSLDAHATSIQVTVKEGGVKLLQIQDNGTGIRKQDLEIVCERFTTSKLQKFEDLSSLATYGFRGEALASISHVAHLTIVTKTADEKCAYRVTYEDGKWKAPPVPCGGNQGTQIIVENLFYNVATRHKMLKNTSEEFQKISEVVSRYAIHNSHAGFALKKYGDDEVSIKTLPKSTTTDNIRTIYGNQVARELKEVEAEDETLKFKFKGHITNLNYHSNKFIFLLFINHRLVESDALKKELDQLYGTYLPTGTHPFLYLSLELDPKNVDVNVHPTKHTVCFLHEELIVRKIKAAIQRVLLGDSSSRSFQLQSLLPNSGRIPVSKDGTQEDKDKTRIYAHQKVRTSSSDQKLDKFFGSPLSLQHEKSTSSDLIVADSYVKKPPAQQLEEKTFKMTDKRREFRLTSLLRLQAEVGKQVHATLKNVISGLIFVSCVDEDYALIQHNTDLYLCNTTQLSQELFYQLMLNDFGNFGVIKFTNPISIEELVMLALESDKNKSLIAQEEQARSVSRTLVKQAPMLEDYFSLEIDTSGNLLAIPILLKQYFPVMAGLPGYILNLATKVNWQNEQDCFDKLCRETAYFYSRPPLITPEQTGEGSNQDNSSTSDANKWKWTTEHIIYPALKKNLLPPTSFVDDRTVYHITRIEDLYSVFERC